MEAKHNYTPFLKFKVNEVAGLSALSGDLKKKLTPFFDFARKDGITREDFEKNAEACCKKAKKYLHEFRYIFVDCFDIPDSISLARTANCKVIIDEFFEIEYVPVLGLDRALNHNRTIFDAKAANKIISDKVAVRFQAEEFSSFDLIEEELLELVTEGSKVFSEWVLIFDCRYCLASDRMKLASEIANFISAANSAADIVQYIIVGSSIPSSITDIAKPSDESLVMRAELDIFHATQSMVKDIPLSLGDYTIVSPLYSDLTLPPELLLSVTAPKVFYTFENYHYIARGGRIKTGGYGQYNVICEQIVAKKFYRQAPYSWGDNFIQERANGIGAKNVTPSTILKPTICAHIEYMSKHYPM
jgi:hypothetical protein